eukprot:sb/3474537/
MTSHDVTCCHVRCHVTSPCHTVTSHHDVIESCAGKRRKKVFKLCKEVHFCTKGQNKGYPYFYKCWQALRQVFPAGKGHSIVENGTAIPPKNGVQRGYPLFLTIPSYSLLIMKILKAFRVFLVYSLCALWGFPPVPW